MKQILTMVTILAIILTMGEWSLAQERPGNLAQGEALYKLHCLRCHGVNGKGDGPDASTLIVKPTNFHSLESRSKTT